jgi:hypothetical protein
MKRFFTQYYSREAILKRRDSSYVITSTVFGFCTACYVITSDSFFERSHKNSTVKNISNTITNTVMLVATPIMASQAIVIGGLPFIIGVATICPAYSVYQRYKE